MTRRYGDDRFSLPTKRMDGDETRWRPPPLLWIPLLLSGSLLFLVDVFQLNSYNIPSSTPQPRFLGFSEEMDLVGFFVKTPGCRIPEMHAFDTSILQYIERVPPLVCNNGTPALYESNLTHIYMLKSSLLTYAINDTSALKCCYSSFWRSLPKKGESDNAATFNSTCVEVWESAIIKDEYIRVICAYNGTEVYKDFFAFVPLKPTPPNQIQENVEELPLNILVIGLDAISRLNLHRQMPKTVKFFEDIAAIELLGYNKVGDNTFPNLIPVLTGLSETELTKACWPKKETKFDQCPFIWKKFKEKGYSTAFGEDSAWMGIFNYGKKGFTQQPTDYFWRIFNFISENQIGNEHKMNAYQCAGARPVYRTMLEYIDKYIQTMHINRRPYFGFFWGASISHDFLNRPQSGDEDYANFFAALNERGALKNTALIFMSDHGIRWGGIRYTYQGRMEERLPFLYIALPETYRETYRQTYTNLRRNRRRLTTPYDLHETLVDLTNPFTLTKESLDERLTPSEKNAYSLFEMIPTNRTCEMAKISPHWCTCQRSYEISTNDETIVEAAKFSVDYMNLQLDGYADCANLTLAEVVNARIDIPSEHVSKDNVTNDYTLTIRTTPGDGVFEVTVRKKLDKDKKFTFNVTGTISRINLYGKQSLCITDFHLKLYCYCYK